MRVLVCNEETVGNIPNDKGHTVITILRKMSEEMIRLAEILESRIGSATKSAVNE